MQEDTEWLVIPDEIWEKVLDEAYGDTAAGAGSSRSHAGSEHAAELRRIAATLESD